MPEFKPSYAPPHAVEPEWLAGRIATLLGYYFQESDADVIMEAQAEDWLDILGPYPQWAIAEACRTYLMDEPVRRPTPGAIRARAVKALDAEARATRPALPAPPPRAEPERVRCSPEAAARILAEAGMSPARLAAISTGRRMPPPSQPGYEPPPPVSYIDPETDRPKPYTAEELAMIRASAASGRYGMVAVPRPEELRA